MQYKFTMPTEIFFGDGIVAANADKLALGRQAFIVTGAHSGRLSGALDDVKNALDAQGAAYDIFEGIGNNPNVSQCRELGERAKSAGADFIVGIGGGSPLDAAKAVAVFAKNDITDEQLFNNDYPGGALKIAAVPTTSGTGSEVTPWSIMTWDEKKTKVSFGSRPTFPAVALLDPKYTASLPADITFDTAMDAFQHCLESLVSMRANPMSDAININALRLFKKCMPRLIKGDHQSLRERLMTVSMMGGCTIAQTGTTLMHAMGYPLTYFKGVPHGRANCMVMSAYLDEIEKHRPERLKMALTVLDMTKAGLQAYVKRGAPVSITATDEELALWAEQTSLKHPDNTTGTPPEPEHILELYKKVFAK